MDSLTQAVLGASIGGALLSPYHGRKALVAGAILATLPDLDVFFTYPDPITAMTSHRGFSHSVLVLTALAFVLSLCWRYLKPDPRYSWLRLFMAVFLALVTHPLLDAFTSYGTQLWWPATPIPASWSSIFIIDPAYTLPLLLATLLGLFWGARPSVQRLCYWALGLSTLYLALTMGAKQWAEQQAQRVLAHEAPQITRIFSTPQPFSLLLWRVVVRTQDGQDCEVVTGLLDGWQDQGTPEYLCLPNHQDYLDLISDNEPLNRLRWFSDDWLRYDMIDDLLVVSDLRMGVGPGLYSFRFVVAERLMDDRWSNVLPYRWTGGTTVAPVKALKTVLRRSIDSRQALPLQDWAKYLTQGVTLP